MQQNAAGAWLPKLSERLNSLDPSSLRWLRQLGARHVVWDSRLPAEKGFFTTADLLKAKQQCQDEDLILEVMRMPNSLRPVMLGLPERDEAIENICRTIRAAGEAGVPAMMWVFTLDSYWDERVGYYPVPGRGGCTERAFDFDRVRDAAPFEEFGVIDTEVMWDRLLYFARPVVAAAEQAGVRMALHPCDPPVPVMRGVPRLFHKPEAYLRFFEAVPSPANGMTFCQGVFAEMGTDVLAEIRRFAAMGKINLVHFRGVRGTVPQYTETFLDEGELSSVLAMKTYKEVGYEGPIVSDHMPLMEGEQPSGYVGGRIGTALAHGYMRAAVQAVNILG